VGRQSAIPHASSRRWKGGGWSRGGTLRQTASLRRKRRRMPPNFQSHKRLNARLSWGVKSLGTLNGLAAGTLECLDHTTKELERTARVLRHTHSADGFGVAGK
jgi:hypothetical protein